MSEEFWRQCGDFKELYRESLSNEDGDVNKNGKKAIGLDW